ncbi:ribonuclease D [Aliamphritea ceti]|uniref:ribonuclease D n=1 Tax=Aliamphritea ceti TaxID=1524258 RepID=UPI0021C4857C|nr:ribonuclease D [Aliamphritea ceti]
MNAGSSAPYDHLALENAAKEPVWVRSDEELASCCQHWLTLPLIALDTEFIRVDTFYPLPGLIQVADDQRCYLLDPLLLENYQPLIEVFRASSVLKVLHACNEDLELFLYMLGEMPTPVFDTQVAAGFLGWGFSMGYQRIVEHALGIAVGKGETRSDWLQRPLTAAQEHYATLDVAYLPALYLKQKEELDTREMTAWLEDELQQLLANIPDQDPDGVHYYKRFSQAWKLPAEKLAALRDLTAWRERICRQRDVPRNRVLRNQTLIDIVYTWPTSEYALSQIDDIRPRSIRQDGSTILSYLQMAKSSAAENPPESIVQPLSYDWNKPLKQLKAMAREKATELNMAPEVLLRKKDLDALIRTGEQGEYSLPETLSGWRKSVIGDALVIKLKEIA